MKLFLAAIKDNAVDAFQPGVFVCRAKGEALRNFSDAINDPNNKQLHHHAADFDLYILGELDDTSGKIDSSPERLARGTDVKQT